jgi:hypothetical protein
MRPPVLVLYWYPINLRMRAAVEAHIHALDVGDHPVVYHNAFLAPAPWLRRTRFAGVVLHNTFLGVRWNVDFDAYREAFAWLSEIETTKVAIPQDEYDHSEILDEWLAELRVSAVLSNFRAEHRGSLYPTQAGGADFHEVLTGYIDDDAAARVSRRLGPLSERSSDIVYRAAKLPYWFGSHGQLKHRIAGAVNARSSELGIRADISTRWEDTILGDAWWDFLLSGRAVVGCESGSSVLDRRGEIRKGVQSLLAEHPDATFDEVSASMPPGWDSWTFFAISPRHLEAVLTKTCQILVEGEYSGVLEPHRHYIPLARDFSNLDEVIEQVRDTPRATELTETAYDEVFRSGEWSYKSFAALIQRCLELETRVSPDGRISVPVAVTQRLQQATERAARINADWFPHARQVPGIALTSPSSTWVPQGERYLLWPLIWMRRVRSFARPRAARFASLARRRLPGAAGMDRKPLDGGKD